MDRALTQDAAMFRLAFRDIALGLTKFLKDLEKPRTAKDLIEMSADLSIMAERFDSLTRGVLDLQGRIAL